MTPALVLVGTPIGNLGDLSPRAVEELSRADVIACEDTRRTRSLLQHAGIAVPKLLVVNDHTEVDRAESIVDLIARGQRVALVSDAGMPGISDPGERLVHAVVEAGLSVEVVPGPSASLTALVLSGLPAGRFAYEGFLPRKGSGRAERLGVVAMETRTTVLFEAPHRLARTLADLVDRCGPDRPVAVGRELTKRYEEMFRGTLAAALEWVGDGVKGEVVIVLGAAPQAATATDTDIVGALQAELAAGASTRDAVVAVTDLLAVPKRRVYEIANDLD